MSTHHGTAPAHGSAPRVSVIIPAFNVAPFIGEQLYALRAQVGAPAFEVIVGDNGSTDGTADACRAHAEGLDLTVVDASGPASASHARNVAASHARATLLALCDADDLVDPHWLASLYAAHTETGADIIQGAIHHERFNAPHILEGYAIGPDPLITNTTPLVDENPPGFAGYLPTTGGNNLAVTKEYFDKVGGYDTDYPGGSEDTAFAWKVQEAGGLMVGCPRAIVHYRLKDSLPAIIRQQRIQQRGRIYLWTKFRHSTMTGPSLKASTLALAKAAPAYAAKRLARRSAVREAWLLGAHMGAIEGILKYRILALARRKSHA